MLKMETNCSPTLLTPAPGVSGRRDLQSQHHEQLGTGQESVWRPDPLDHLPAGRLFCYDNSNDFSSKDNDFLCD